MRASSKSMLTAGSGCTMASLLTLCCLCNIKSFATQMYLTKCVRNKTVILGTFPHQHQTSRWSYECMFPCSFPASCSKVGRKKNMRFGFLTYKWVGPFNSRHTDWCMQSCFHLSSAGDGLDSTTDNQQAKCPW